MNQLLPRKVASSWSRSWSSDGQLVGPEDGSLVWPDIGPEVGPFLGTDIGPDVRQEVRADVGVDVGSPVGPRGGGTRWGLKLSNGQEVGVLGPKVTAWLCKTSCYELFDCMTQQIKTASYTNENVF